MEVFTAGQKIIVQGWIKEAVLNAIEAHEYSCHCPGTLAGAPPEDAEVTEPEVTAETARADIEADNPTVI